MLTDGSPLRALVWFNDGSQLALFHTLSPIEEGKVSGQPAELEVQLRERYWGIETGKPTWLIRAELIRSAANLAKVRGVKFKRYTDQKELISAARKELFAEFKVTHTDNIIALVDVAGNDEPMEITVSTSPLLGRTEQPLVLRQIKVGLPGRLIQPKAAAIAEMAIHVAPGLTWTGQQPDEREWIMSIDGPEEKLEQIDQVNWRIPGKPDSETPTYWRQGERSGAFAVRFTGKTAPAIQAKITLIDETIEKLTRE